MSVVPSDCGAATVLNSGFIDTAIFDWYAIRVLSNRERLVEYTLSGKGLDVCLPLYYSYRRSRSGDPRVLFPGYVFCSFDVTHPLPVLMTPGVVQIVCCGKTPQPVDPAEMSAVRALAKSGVRSEPCEYFKAGQRVRICEGPMAGVEGTAVREGGRNKLVISVSLLMRSVMVELETCDVEAVLRRPLASAAGRAVLAQAS